MGHTVVGCRRVMTIRMVALSFASAAILAAADKPVSFAKEIEPVLQGSCWKCHGSAIQLSKLDLRTRDAALKGGEKGPAIVPGKADQSKLYRLVAGLEKPAMPMDGKLTAEQISTIKDWIDQGATWEGASAGKTDSGGQLSALEDMQIPPEARQYWAFQKPVRRAMPIPTDSSTISRARTHGVIGIM